MSCSRRRRRRIPGLPGLMGSGLALLGLALPAAAHTTSTGLARLDLQGSDAHYQLNLSPAEIGAAATPVQRGAAGDVVAARQVGALLQAHLALAVNGQPCRLKRTRLQASQLGDERVALLLDWQCADAPGTLLLRDTLSTAFGDHYRTIVSIRRMGVGADPDQAPDQAPEHAPAQPGASAARPADATADVLKVAPPAGNRQEHILDQAHPQVQLDFSQPAPSGFLAFVQLGAGHILGGADHLLFLAALLLGSHGLRPLLVTATAFTLAHSLSLAAATLGWVPGSSHWVEPLIAASIIWVALQNTLENSRRKRCLPARPLRRPALAFGFGLVHGLAFAEALTPLQLSGWPLARALLGFNLGVEAGQALVILALLPALHGLARQRAANTIVQTLSLAVAALGVFWLVQRLAA